MIAQSVPKNAPRKYPLFLKERQPGLRPGPPLPNIHLPSENTLHVLILPSEAMHQHFSIVHKAYALLQHPQWVAQKSRSSSSSLR